MGILIYIYADGIGNNLNYWIATANPFTRIPVFFMGVVAGVLCIRIQDGDIDALSSEIIYLHHLNLLPYLQTYHLSNKEGQ